MTFEQWQQIVQATDIQELCAALAQAGVSDWYQATHVAIDRWTGGAAPGLLFSLLEPHGQTWEPLRLQLDFGRLLPEEQAPAITLLLLVLRDLIRNAVSFGHGTNHGRGHIQVTRLAVTSRDVSDTLAALESVMLGPQRTLGLDPALMVDLHRDWHTWLGYSSQAGEPNRQHQGVPA